MTKRSRRARLPRIPYTRRLKSWGRWNIVFPEVAALTRAGAALGLLRRLETVEDPEETKFAQRADRGSGVDAPNLGRRVRPDARGCGPDSHVSRACAGGILVPVFGWHAKKKGQVDVVGNDPDIRCAGDASARAEPRAGRTRRPRRASNGSTYTATATVSGSSVDTRARAAARSRKARRRMSLGMSSAVSSTRRTGSAERHDYAADWGVGEEVGSCERSP